MKSAFNKIFISVAFLTAACSQSEAEPRSVASVPLQQQPVDSSCKVSVEDNDFYNQQTKQYEYYVFMPADRCGKKVEFLNNAKGDVKIMPTTTGDGKSGFMIKSSEEVDVEADVTGDKITISVKPDLIPGID